MTIETGSFKEQLEAERDRLRDAVSFLERENPGTIEDGTYGVCEICGKPIGEERLAAIPWARYCIDDARKLG
jgi:RNA polymerase-binding transcription factor